jgi:ribosome modulation factor
LKTDTSAYEHGRNAAQHGKHIQACPFDTGTDEWRGWRQGFCDARKAEAKTR